VLFTSPREFRLWRYGVGHSQLLLRSLPTETEPCLDVLFEGVRRIELPTHLSSLTIELTHTRDLRPDLPSKLLRLRLSATDGSGAIECGKVSAYTTTWTVTGNEDPVLLETLFEQHHGQ
jgi:hypothetical protein